MNASAQGYQPNSHSSGTRRIHSVREPLKGFFERCACACCYGNCHVADDLSRCPGLRGAGARAAPSVPNAISPKATSTKNESASEQSVSDVDGRGTLVGFPRSRDTPTPTLSLAAAISMADIYSQLLVQTFLKRSCAARLQAIGA